ncbi:UDP-N-acetylmuramate dehydrogenase [Pseudoxanthomonas gei]|uniref:UDP-N-acetylenolpyruvoylglucosamine reductase n=1 Tax=Pseudoxanthomonas gei TaxID=1383030 RepID=A0ABX0A800_9GAMM|nr:UDP-N-acetylmuramate dehydrogenase [Pseudoxanthomonas gei]NDK37663.1 UDP-N-acetylmuramate dehydrogenase [Pseudoxanthomonas gei]
MKQQYRLTANADLRSRNTFGISARANQLVEIQEVDALPEVLALPAFRDNIPLVLGGGSNLLFASDPQAPLLAFDTHRVEIVDDDGATALLRAEAGVEWHALVMRSLEMGLCGLENLALIPGTTGAAPIQNIGAYGTEVGEFVHAVEAWDRQRGSMVRLDRDACTFAYRDSLFKRLPDRYLLTALELALPRQRELRLDYAGIPQELSALGIAAPTARDVAEAVVRIRRRKLPDPAVVGNAGSFFKNPIVPLPQAETLLLANPGLPLFGGDDEATGKLSAAWMIEQCGWKGFRDGDAGVAASHALVLVNHGLASGAQLLALARRIANSVQERFGVDLQPEPRIIGAQW